MLPVLLSALCVLAGIGTLVPDPFVEFAREYVVITLAGLVLVGIVAGHLLAEVQIRTAVRISVSGMPDTHEGTS
jgi:hypothetical protein